MTTFKKDFTNFALALMYGGVCGVSLPAQAGMLMPRMPQMQPAPVQRMPAQYNRQSNQTYQRMNGMKIQDNQVIKTQKNNFRKDSYSTTNVDATKKSKFGTTKTTKIQGDGEGNVTGITKVKTTRFGRTTATTHELDHELDKDGNIRKTKTTNIHKTKTTLNTSRLTGKTTMTTAGSTNGKKVGQVTTTEKTSKSGKVETVVKDGKHIYKTVNHPDGTTTKTVSQQGRFFNRKIDTTVTNRNTGEVISSKGSLKGISQAADKHQAISARRTEHQANESRAQATHTGIHAVDYKQHRQDHYQQKSSLFQRSGAKDHRLAAQVSHPMNHQSGQGSITGNAPISNSASTSTSTSTSSTLTNNAVGANTAVSKDVVKGLGSNHWASQDYLAAPKNSVANLTPTVTNSATAGATRSLATPNASTGVGASTARLAPQASEEKLKASMAQYDARKLAQFPKIEPPKSAVNPNDLVNAKEKLKITGSPLVPADYTKPAAPSSVGWD